MGLIADYPRPAPLHLPSALLLGGAMPAMPEPCRDVVAAQFVALRLLMSTVHCANVSPRSAVKTCYAWAHTRSTVEDLRTPSLGRYVCCDCDADHRYQAFCSPVQYCKALRAVTHHRPSKIESISASQKYREKLRPQTRCHPINASVPGKKRATPLTPPREHSRTCCRR